MVKIPAFRGRVKKLDGFGDGVLEGFPTGRSGLLGRPVGGSEGL